MSLSDRGHSRSPSTAMPIFRLLSLLVMLAVIGLTIYNLHRRASVPVPSPTNQPDARSVEKVPTNPPKKRRPLADENTKESGQFRHDSEAILDKATVIRAFELPAYYRMLNWVQSQSLTDLKERSYSTIPFQGLINHPDKYRGRPIRVELLIRRVLSFELDRAENESGPNKLYELWGWPTASDGWLYVVVTPELPPGFPTGKDIEVTATVYGYFFKVQGYQPADANPNARPLVAPLLMGRVAPVAVIAGPAPRNTLNWVILLIGVVTLIAVIAGWIVAARRKPITRVESTLTWPDSMDKVADD
jgi:hypothetical protein